MLKSNERLPLRRQHCAIAPGESVLTTVVLMRLRNFYRAQIGLAPVWYDQIPRIVIAHLFLASYEAYHDFGENVHVRWQRCERDFKDFVDGKIDLERYVMSTYERLLEQKLKSQPRVDARTRFLEVKVADRLWDIDFDMGLLLALMAGPVPPLALTPTAVSRVIVESSKYGARCKEEGRDISDQPDASRFILPDDAGTIVPFVETQGVAMM